MIGKIYEKIDDNFGYIIDDQDNLYLFSTNDILDDTKIEIGVEVYFKPSEGQILMANYISKVD